MYSGDEFYDDEVTSGLLPDDNDGSGRLGDGASGRTARPAAYEDMDLEADSDADLTDDGVEA
jgi:hypothetical protein